MQRMQAPVRPCVRKEQRATESVPKMPGGLLHNFRSLEHLRSCQPAERCSPLIGVAVDDTFQQWYLGLLERLDGLLVVRLQVSGNRARDVHAHAHAHTDEWHSDRTVRRRALSLALPNANQTKRKNEFEAWARATGPGPLPFRRDCAGTTRCYGSRRRAPHGPWHCESSQSPQGNG